MNDRTKILYETIVQRTLADLLPWSWHGIGWAAHKDEVYFALVEDTVGITISSNFTSFTVPDERLRNLLLTRYTKRNKESIEEQVLEVLNLMEAPKDYNITAKRLLED